MKKLLALATIIFILTEATMAQAAIVTKEIPYNDGGVSLTGYFAYDDAIKTPVPGVLVIHEWWGLNGYAKARAEQLAKLGYAAFAIDMYGTGVGAETPDEATKLSKPFYDDRKMMQTRASAGLAVLQSQPQADASKIAVIGYCFGGTVALEMARAGTDVKGVVSFHGGLSTPNPAVPATVKAQVLALNGGADPMVPQAEKDAFVKEMTAGGVTFRSIDYPGALHAFTNPKATEIGEKFKIPVAYDADADKKSWEEMQKFFGILFR